MTNTVDTRIDLMPSPAGHSVCFYPDDGRLTDLVGAYLTAGLAAGETVIVIATAEHREAFVSALMRAGADVDRAEDEKRLVMADADQALAGFMDHDRPNPARFDATVGVLIRQAAASGRSVRTYGEMVARLAEAGNVAGSIDLEALWNGLAERSAFGLLCAYPVAALADQSLTQAFDQLCHLHTQVVAGAPEIAEAEVSRRFLATDHAPELARRFAASALEEWGYHDPADVVLAASELAANAVRYAGGDLTVGLGRTGGAVRLAVGDTSIVPPSMATPSPSRIGGRGLRIVEAVSRRWGHDVLPGGKIVWADIQLRLPPVRPRKGEDN